MVKRTARPQGRAKGKSGTARHTKAHSETCELLLEIGTEELPPKSLKNLSVALAARLYEGLRAAELVDDSEQRYHVYATPRRLAVSVADVLQRQPDRVIERRGPSWQAAFDERGQPSQAAIGFARSCGVSPQKLQRLENDKGAWLAFRRKEKGALARTLIAGIIDEALRRLPIAKRMRWGDGDAEFVRPVHWVVVLHGDKVIPCTLLRVKADRYTRGHRFHYPKAIALRSAAAYPGPLATRGYVVADFDLRKSMIRTKVHALAKRKNGIAVIDEALLDEVTGLVEWPVPLLGIFDRAFLDIPPEPLVSTMRDHQKCFHVISSKGALLPYFITVSNIRSKNVSKVREGNERVIHARFADARFFWETDRKSSLGSRVPALKDVVFQDKLGSMYDRVVRVRQLAGVIAEQVHHDRSLAERAAWLCKADLMTGMVGEFPELQGVMGRYYAEHDGEPSVVAAAIEEHYLPRHAGDRLPPAPAGQALAIADRIDTLIGVFAVGEGPTGDKDPFGLRRAALGVLRIVIECKLALDLNTLLEVAWRSLPDSVRSAGLVAQVYDFMMDRLRAYYVDAGVSQDVYEAVLACRPRRPADFDRRVRAVMAFRQLPEAQSLTIANKRIRNILRQGGNADWDHVSTVLLKEAAEKDLAQQLDLLRQELKPLFDAGDYTQAMTRLAALRPQVDQFFDKVMVMVDEEAIRDNRLALLNSLSALFLRVADLSKLQG